MRGQGIWLLPHAVALAAFAAAFGVISATGTNRTDADLYLGTAGFIAGGLGVATSAVALARLALMPGSSPRWPWLLLHLGALTATLGAAATWIGAHLA